jgi:cardiolipin synthase
MFKYHKKQLNQLKEAGVEVGIFNPKGINIVKGSSNYRIHSKMVVIDNKEALYGDSNFGDEYLDFDPKVHY